jgi:hypothetical protein
MLETGSKFLFVFVIILSCSALSSCGGDTDEQSATLCCAEPVELATGVTSDALYVDSQYIYWPGSLTLKRLPKDGGDVALIAEGLAPAATLLGDDEFLYLVHNSLADATVIRRISKDGPIDDVVGEGKTWLCDAALDEDSVYWSEDDGAIYSVAKNGSSINPYQVTHAFGCADLAVGAEYIYYADEGGIHRIDKLGEGDTELVGFDLSQTTYVSGLVLQGDSLFWAQRVVGEPGEVKSIPKLGGSPTTLASGQENLFDLAVDESHVYWTNYESGRLRRVSVGGGTIEEIRAVTEYVAAVALDKNYVYWLEGHSLMKRAK